MAILSAKQIYALAADAGFRTPGQATTMTAIALAESGGKTDAVNRNSNGSTDTGLWQINSIHGYSQASLMDPRQNARAAKAVFDKQGYTAWVVFNEDKYQRYLGESTKAASETSGTSIADILKALPVAAGTLLDVGKDVAGEVNPLQGIEGVAKALGGLVELAAKAGTFMSDPQNWLRIAYVGVGVALIIGGLVVFAAPVAEPVVKTAAKAADIAL
jgi:Lysozyme like domain